MMEPHPQQAELKGTWHESMRARQRPCLAQHLHSSFSCRLSRRMHLGGTLSALSWQSGGFDVFHWQGDYVLSVPNIGLVQARLERCQASIFKLPGHPGFRTGWLLREKLATGEAQGGRPVEILKAIIFTLQSSTTEPDGTFFWFVDMFRADNHYPITVSVFSSRRRAWAGADSSITTWCPGPGPLKTW